MHRKEALVAVVLATAVGLGCGGGESDGVDAGGADADPVAPDARPADARELVPCDPLTQLGCGSDEKCSIVPPALSGDPPEVGCVPLNGSQGAFQPCTPASLVSSDDCARGMVCVGTLAPRCLPFCSNEPVDTCDTGQICAFGEDLDGDWVVDVSFCAEACDLLTQDCDDPLFACYPTLQGAACALAGAGETPALEGESCEYANSCAEGLGCFRIGVSLEWLCFALCDPYGTSGPACAVDQICNPVEDEAWGVCRDDV